MTRSATPSIEESLEEHREMADETESAFVASQLLALNKLSDKRSFVDGKPAKACTLS